MIIGVVQTKGGTSTQKGMMQGRIRVIRGRNDLLVIDTPGESSGKLHTKIACALSDVIVIPMRSSTND